MDITCVSDLHGFQPELPGGDLLIVAGDLTSRNTQNEHMKFISWIAQQKYKKKIWIAGNHDSYLVGTKFIPIKYLGLEYLCDSATEFEGLKIWGTPWTKTFEGINPHCKAFTCDTEEELAEKWAMIPDDTHILITHGPPYGVFDYCHGEYVGSTSLNKIVLSKERLPNLKLHIFGHIHACGGRSTDLISGKFINCSHVNEHYQPVNKPVIIIL